MSDEDLSEYVTHFTKAVSWADAPENFQRICYSRVISATSPWGIAKSGTSNIPSQKSVCFTEAPLHCLSRIAARRSKYGIGFTKSFAISQGAERVWYVTKDSEPYAALQKLISEAKNSPKSPEHPIWKLTPFIDAPGVYGETQYFFEWEREWRCNDSFRFGEQDVAFLIVPEHEHQVVREFFEMVRADCLGPSYDCAIFDSDWPSERIAKALDESQQR